MARPMATMLRRCRLRVILALGFVYFLVMYVFHLSLQESGDGGGDRSPSDWDRLEIGGDAAVDVNRRRVERFDVDMQEAFDRVQLDELQDKGVERLKSDQRNLTELDKEEQQRSKVHARQLDARIEPNHVREKDSLNREDTRWKFPQGMTSEFLDDVNIPPNCREVYKEAEFRFRKISSDVFLYSAFWDSRQNDFDNRKNGSLVRIMAIKPREAKPTLGCLFDTADAPDATLALESRVTYYEMCENHGRSYGGYILSCPVPPGVTTPTCSVTIAHVTDDVVTETVRLRIRTLEPAPNRRSFSVCVPPLFGSVSVARLTEFLEMSRLLGAEHVTMYDVDMTSEVRTLLGYYEKQTRFVTVVPWRLDRSIDDGIWYHGQLISIQDCLYRSMATAEYVSFNDIDEFIVPRNSYHWKDMLQELDHPIRCAFQFKTAFFKPELDETDAKNPSAVDLDLQTLVHFKRTKNFDRIRTKCMVKTFSIFEQGIHHVSKPIWADFEVHRVEPDVAFLHHYRVCLHGMGMNCAAYEVDKTMLRYGEELTSATNTTKFRSRYVVF